MPTSRGSSHSCSSVFCWRPRRRRRWMEGLRPQTSGFRKTGRKGTRMTEESRDNNGRPILNIQGELVVLGPIRRDLLPLYQRWINDLHTMRTLDLPPRPLTMEQEQD